MAKWRAKVVGDGIGKRFQVLVACFEFRSLVGEFLIEFANFVLSLLALLEFDPKVVAGLAKTILDPASNRAERADNYSPSYENEKVR